ncbi:MAG TPA: hypothetical protein VE011_10520 [Candidatus Dormibacteraeota bacterium]|nr:hypothetical protein [Candidatus Dormibacteraeota bacterium]
MAATKTKANIWTDEERAAMLASATERKKSAKLSPAEERAAGEAEVREKLNGMPTADRIMGERIYELVMKAEPSLVPKTYYGMPAWAKDGKTICFYKPKSKFKVRYSTFEFQPDARLDDGEFWAVSFAVDRLTPSAEQQIVALVKKAAG